MILAKSAIQDALRAGHLSVDPMNEESIQPASIDLRLGTHFLIPDFNFFYHPYDIGDAPMLEQEGEEIIIPAMGFLLARTIERIRLSDDISGFVEGRSSVGRGGLFIHNAGFIDPGFEGTITLELFNAFPAPLRLKAGRRICQIVLMDCRGESGGYHGKYQGQTNTTASMFDKDPEVVRGKV